MKAEIYTKNRPLFFSQLFLFKNKDILNKVKNTFSQGRTFGYLGVNRRNLLQRLKATSFPPRILIHCKQNEYNSIIKELEKIGYKSSPPLNIMIGNKESVIPSTAQIIKRFNGYKNLSVKKLNHYSPSKYVLSLQKLQEESGIIPVPGWVLRGLDKKTNTTTILNEMKYIIGGISTQTINYKRKKISLGFGLCISKKYRGQKIGLFLNSLALRNNIQCNDYIIEIVSSLNIPSIKINEQCGLHKLNHHSFIFAEREIIN